MVMASMARSISAGPAQADEVRVHRQPQRGRPELTGLRLDVPRLQRRTDAADLQRQRPLALAGAIVELHVDSVGAGRQREAAVVDDAHRLLVGALHRPHAERQLRHYLDGRAAAQRIVDHRRRPDAGVEAIERRQPRSRPQINVGHRLRGKERHRHRDDDQRRGQRGRGGERRRARVRGAHPRQHERGRERHGEPPHRLQRGDRPGMPDEGRRERPQFPSRRPEGEQRRRAVTRVVDQQAVLGNRQRDARCRC